jgi:predicted dinucleotide-binding enzyme
MQHVPAKSLGELDHDLSGDVLVVGDDDDARALVMSIVGGIRGLRAFDGGSLYNAVGIETFAAAMLTVNLRHQGETNLHLGGVGDVRRPSSAEAR